MNSIYRESEFLSFMKINGPNAITSRKSYISWLNFVASNFGGIDQSLTHERIEEICSNIRKNNEYQTDKDIKSALNKYFKFINTTPKSSDFSNDLIEILNQKSITTKKYEIDTRIGQGKYREELIKLWSMCSVTKYSKVDLLVASHIKPWADSSNLERIDPYNGLLLTPNVDKLFDLGYISFSSKGNIIISNMFTEFDQSEMGISNSLKLYKIYDKNLSYLSYHRERILLK